MTKLTTITLVAFLWPQPTQPPQYIIFPQTMVYAVGCSPYAPIKRAYDEPSSWKIIECEADR